MTSGTGAASAASVLIAGPTALFRDVLRHEADHRGLDVLSDVADTNDLVAAVVALEPDVVIIEAPPTDEWFESLTDLGSTGSAMIVVTDNSSPQHVVELLSAGVDGVFGSDASPTEVLEGAQTVLDGGAALHHDVAALLLQQWRALRGARTPGGSSRRSDLTPREHDVLVAMAEGLSTKAVARRLGVAVKTVENHKTRVYQKLGARSNAHAISMAIRLGLLHTGPRSA